MNLTEHHSDASWRFEWETPHGRVALRYVAGRETWERLMRIADPVTGKRGGWNAPQDVPDLPLVDTEAEAKEQAEKYARRKP